MKFVLVVMVMLITLAQYVPGINIDVVNLYASRLMVMGVLVYSTLISKVKPRISKSVYFIICIYSLWVVYAVGSYFWSVDKAANLKESSAILYGFASILAFVMLSSRRDYYDGMYLGLWLSFAMCAVIALWEMATLSHLNSSYVKDSPHYVLMFPFAQATFGNPNNYSSFLIIFMPLTIMHINGKYNRLIKIGSVLAISFILTMMFINASRISLAVAFGYLAYEIFNVRKIHISYKIILITIVVTSVYLSLGKISSYFETYVYATGEGSLQARINMYKNAIWMFNQSIGFGVGAGNFDYIVSNGLAPFYVGRNTSPHSLVFEIVSQYGLIGLILFLSAIYLTVKWTQKAYYKLDHNQDSRSVYYSQVILLFIVSSFQNSGYIVSPVTWLVLAVCTSFLNYQIVSR